MQKFYCIGNLTKKPDYYETQNGNAVSKFCVAVNRPHNREETDYFNIVTWNGLAESCQKHLDKGSKVAVLGYLQTRSFSDQSGIKKFITEVVAQEVEFLSQSMYSKVDEEINKEKKTEFVQDKFNYDLPF